MCIFVHSRWPCSLTINWKDEAEENKKTLVTDAKVILSTVLTPPGNLVHVNFFFFFVLKAHFQYSFDILHDEETYPEFAGRNVLYLSHFL